MLFMFIVALAAAMAVGYLMWKAMSQDQSQDQSRGQSRGQSQNPQRPAPARPRAAAPDDDPEFLRKLGERLRSEGEDPPTRR